MTGTFSLIKGAVSWFILDENSVHINRVELGGGSRVLFTRFSSAAITVDTISDDGSGQLFIPPSHSLEITNQLSSCLVTFRSSVLAFSKQDGKFVTIDRSLHVYGELNLTSFPNIRIGRFGGSFIMQPGSQPTRLQFSNFVVDNSIGYEVKLVQNQKPKVMDVSGGQFALGNKANFRSVDPLTLSARDVVINGVFEVENLTDADWDSFLVGDQGKMNVEVTSNLFRVAKVTINGQVQLLTTNITIRSASVVLGSRSSLVLSNVTGYIDRLDISGSLTVRGSLDLYDRSGTASTSIAIRSGGTVKILNNVDVYERRSGLSHIRASTLDIDGQFLAGDVSAVGGWSRLNVMLNGSMVAEFHDELRVDSLHIMGGFQVENPVSVRGFTTRLTGIIFISSTGTFILNSGKRSGSSLIRASTVEIDGRFDAGVLSVAPFWRELVVTGTFNFLPSESFNISTTTVNGTMRTLKPFGRDLPLIGDSLTVNSGGLLSINFQQSLDNISSGSSPSLIQMDKVFIGGRLEAGSIDMYAKQLTVSTSGLITVDWGGYVGGQGPGAGSSSSSGGSGASHGGRGGQADGTTCHKLPYGSIYMNGSWGSGGGYGNREYAGGRGGGKVYFEIESSVKLDGTIQASGEEGKVRLD